MRHPNIRTRNRPPATALEPPTDDLRPAAPPLSAIEYRPLADLQIANRQLRRRAAPLIERHAECMVAHGVDLPIFATREGRIVYGHDTAAAYRHLKRELVPVTFVDHRSPAAMSAVELWMERFHADGEWDYPALKNGFELILQDEPDLWSKRPHRAVAELCKINLLAVGATVEDLARRRRDGPRNGAPDGRLAAS